MTLSLWMVLTLGTAPAAGSLEEGARALEALQTARAVSLLERARGEGPYDLPTHLRLYEQLAIAYAFLERPDDALKAFDRVLALSPGHAVSYTLSPKVTFLFERARNTHAGQPQLDLEVSWPKDIKGGAPLVVNVEKRFDVLELAINLALFSRTRGAPTFQPHPVPAPRPGQSVTVELPEESLGEEGSVVRELYLQATDAAGNEVFRWASSALPREVTSVALVKQAWYQKWWVWSAIGVAVAGATGGIVYWQTRQPPPLLRWSFSFQ